MDDFNILLVLSTLYLREINLFTPKPQTFLYLGGIASATLTLLLLITRINERRSLLRSVRINNETFLKTRINALRLCGLDTFQ